MFKWLLFFTAVLEQLDVLHGARSRNIHTFGTTLNPFFYRISGVGNSYSITLILTLIY